MPDQALTERNLDRFTPGIVDAHCTRLGGIAQGSEALHKARRYWEARWSMQGAMQALCTQASPPVGLRRWGKASRVLSSLQRWSHATSMPRVTGSVRGQARECKRMGSQGSGTTWMPGCMRSLRVKVHPLMRSWTQSWGSFLLCHGDVWLW